MVQNFKNPELNEYTSDSNASFLKKFAHDALSMRTIGAEIGRIFVAKKQSEQQHTHFCCFSFSVPQRNEYTSDFSAVLTHRKRITCGIFRKKNRLNRTYIHDVTGKKQFFGHGHQPGTQQPLFSPFF